MPSYDYIIQRFHGVDQSMSEALTAPGCTHDELNMDTDGGRLCVTAGFTPVNAAAVPGTADISRLFIFRSSAKDIPIACGGGTVYAFGVGENPTGWTAIFTRTPAQLNEAYCCLTARIGMTDYLIVADGRGQMIKYDGAEVTDFGSAEGCSDVACSCAAIYRSRLFAAGDAEHPNRLYYSQLPGGDRSIEDWSYVEDSPSVEGGHVEIGTTGGDPIIAVTPTSNQLVIFKKHSIYRLIGDRPGNFTVERVADRVHGVCPQATAVLNDVLYYLTPEGLCCFNGVDAAPLPDARRICGLMRSANTAASRMAAVGDKLYFTVSVGGETRLVSYDVSERKYLIYGGFAVYDLTELSGSPALISNKRRICRWGAGGSFDGEPIAAHWTTPLTDLGDAGAIKTLRELRLRAETGGEADVTATVGGVRTTSRVRLPAEPDDVAELRMLNEGRTLRLRIANVDGGRFALCGLQLEMSVRKRTE